MNIRDLRDTHSLYRFAHYTLHRQLSLHSTVAYPANYTLLWLSFRAVLA
jgi:hypothetical protein